MEVFDIKNRIDYSLVKKILKNLGDKKQYKIQHL